MTVLFRDVHMNIDHKIVGYGFERYDMWELLYADDTLIIGKRAREISIILKEIIEEWEI